MKLDRGQYLELLGSLLASGHSLTTCGKGSSMWPAIPNGALLYVQPVRPEDVRVGDIVLAKTSGGRPVYHRVARIFRDRGRRWIQTWGEAKDRPDAPVPLSHVLGRLQAIELDGVRTELEPLRPQAARRLRRRYLKLLLRRLLRRPSPSRPGPAYWSAAKTKAIERLLARTPFR